MQWLLKGVLFLCWMEPGFSDPKCEIKNFDNLSFGDYFWDTFLDMDTTFEVECSDLIPGVSVVQYTVSCDAGEHSASLPQRNMEKNSFLLAYNLYKDVGRTVLLGDGTSSTQQITESYTATSDEHTILYTVYGRIPSGETSPEDSYKDTIIATLDYTITP